MTIDVGYAHLALADGTELDFVDVPGHDRLVGNMLVGAGEIDAALLVVAADDGPRAQTLEHLELLDALGIADGVVVVTKVDAVEPGAGRRGRRASRARSLARTIAARRRRSLAVSAATGDGLDALRAALGRASRPGHRARGAEPTAIRETVRLAIDRVFSIRGRGTVVTGTLRGGAIDRAARAARRPGPAAGPSASARSRSTAGPWIERGRVASRSTSPGRRDGASSAAPS